MYSQYYVYTIYKYVYHMHIYIFDIHYTLYIFRKYTLYTVPDPQRVLLRRYTSPLMVSLRPRSGSLAPQDHIFMHGDGYPLSQLCPSI